jgi:type VI secretion system protein ImpA
MTGVLFELETAIQGKPETQFAPAEEPDWRQLEGRILEVAEGTRDLRVGCLLSATLLRTRGLAGLGEGVKLLLGYLERFWPTVYPQLDASDNDDPVERINAMTSLAAPLGTEGDLLRVIRGLRGTTLVAAPRAGRFTLEHYLHVKGLVPWPESAGQAPTSGLLDAAVREAGVEAVAATGRTAAAIVADLEAIEALFKKEAGAGSFPTLLPLRKELQQIVAWLGTGKEEPAAPVAEGEPAAPGTTAVAASAAGFSGAVRSRDEVVKALDAIIAYYRTNEPSSPVPYLLNRVRRVVRMDFMELIKELTPEAIDRILTLTGPVPTDTDGNS